MSLKIAAEHLKSKGRGPDTELIHMTKGEIKGLRQLAQAHGTDLTINPETGLPEAGMLMKILPVVAAAAATYFTAGAAAPALEAALMAEGVAAGTAATYGGLMAGAGAGALIGGASAGLQGGDIGKGALFGGLGGALSGGLGAYDASSALDPALINPETGAAVVKEGATAAAPTLGAPGNPIPAPEGNLYIPPGGNASNIINPAQLTSSNTAQLDQLAKMQGVFPEGAPELAGKGLSAAPSSAAPSYYSKLGTGMSDMATKAGILAAPGLGAQMGAETYDENGVPTGESGSTLDRISPNFRASTPGKPNPYYAANYTDYKKNPYGMADGGPVAFANRGIVQDLPRSSGADVGTYSDTDPNTAKLDAYNAALYRFNKASKKAGIKAPVEFKQAQALGDIEEAASGGVMHGIGGYSDGGRMLKGPGDGMSDSIPAVIGSKQPARLADGEFVVPADVVSHLGNGSTDAGAKRLYGMMDKIRHARTGKKKQAPEVKADKFLPA